MFWVQKGALLKTISVFFLINTLCRISPKKTLFMHQYCNPSAFKALELSKKQKGTHLQIMYKVKMGVKLCSFRFQTSQMLLFQKCVLGSKCFSLWIFVSGMFKKMYYIDFIKSFPFSHKFTHLVPPLPKCIERISPLLLLRITSKSGVSYLWAVAQYLSVSCAGMADTNIQKLLPSLSMCASH